MGNLKFFLTLFVVLLGSSCASLLQIFDVPESDPESEESQMPESNRCDATALSTAQGVQHFSRLDGPKHFAYTYLDFENLGNEMIDRAEFTVQLCNVPEARPYGLYYQIYMKVGGNPIYFGIQTRLFEPGKGTRGPGFIFSRWGLLNGEELRINPKGGFRELGKHEGGFIGVRLPHKLEATSYFFELVREKENWYQLFVTPEGKKRVLVGALRLTGNRGLSNFTLTTEAYAMNNVSTLDIPYWHLLTSVPKVNGVEAHEGSVSYPTKEYPFGTVQIEESNPMYNDAIGEDPFFNVSYGGRSARIKTSSGRFNVPSIVD